VTAVVAMAKYGHAHHYKSSNKATKEKLIRVLLDSGLDGDLLFHEKRKPKSSTQTIGSKITSTSKNPNHNKIKHPPPPSKEKGEVMAVVAMAKYGHAHHHKNSKKAAKEKLI
jgi:hypothetical protein